MKRTQVRLYFQNGRIYEHGFGYEGVRRNGGQLEKDIPIGEHEDGPKIKQI